MMNNPNVSAEEHYPHSLKQSVFQRMMNFFKWWLGFTGLIAGTSMCPFCGQSGCPVGIGVASTMGGFFALFMQNWKEPFKRLYRRFGK